MHDTRMRGRGPYIYQVFYTRASEPETYRGNSILVRSPHRTANAAVAASARGHLDNEGLNRARIREIRPYKELRGKP